MERTNAYSLLDFLDNSPCNFFATATIQRYLDDNGFQELKQSERWNLEKGGKYYVKKNDTAIFGFVIGETPLDQSGFNMISAHSDSPCFRIKPNPEMLADGVLKLNTEVYTLHLVRPSIVACRKGHCTQSTKSSTTNHKID